MFKNLTLAHFLSAGSLLLSFTVLICGNNLIDQFSGPNVVYSTFNVELKYPKQGDRSMPVNQLMPNYYREIRIENIGSKSSTNLILTIELDGEIMDKVITSDEVNSFKCDSSVVRIEFKRFVKHATITCKIWLKRNDKEFNIRLIDDDGIRNELNYASPSKTGYTIIMILASILLIFSAFWLSNILFIRPRNVRISSLEKINIDLEGKVSQMSNELAEFNDKENRKASYEDVFESMKQLVTFYESKK